MEGRGDGEWGGDQKGEEENDGKQKVDTYVESSCLYPEWRWDNFEYFMVR